ncbi:MAG: YIP1 family protein [Phycisphaerales bacterium]
MECKTCGYALWNLKDRTCPECGAGFKPSDYGFRPGAVRYMCPHCGQDYYGTDDRGHLVPRSFDCVSCHTPVTMDEMVLLPAEGVPESKTELQDLPWEDRKARGTFRAWWQTTKAAMLRPGELMSARNDTSSLGAAWGYFAVTFGMIFLIGALLGTLFLALFSLVFSGAGGIPPNFLGIMLLVQLAAFGAAVIITVVFVLLWALATHGLLRVTGACAGSIRTTFHALLYSSGPNFLNAIPCLNNLPIGSVWWVVSAILMIKRGHEVSGLRASFAVLLFPILSVGVLLVGYMAFIAWMVTLTPTTTNFNVAATTHPEMEAMAFAAETRANERGAGWDHTDHALMLLAEDRVDAFDFIAADTPTLLDEIPLTNGETLDDYAEYADGDVADVAGLFDPLPEDVVAHRVGDFVFTWHGIDASDPPPGLWVIVEHNLRDVGSGSDFAYAMQADGAIVDIPPGSMQNFLPAQNALRALHNLRPLPDPTAVTQQEPATAGP